MGLDWPFYNALGERTLARTAVGKNKVWVEGVTECEREWVTYLGMGVVAWEKVRGKARDY
jgi:hypothetical protein